MAARPTEREHELSRIQDMNKRRQLFRTSAAIATAAAAGAVSRVAMAALPEPVIQQSADTMPPLEPSTGRPYKPVVTLNGWTLPWRMKNVRCQVPFEVMQRRKRSYGAIG